jgi:hypothetical protein
MASRYAKTAKIKQVLVFYDGPQLVLLESDRGHPMLGMAVTRGDMYYPIFAAEIIGNQIEKYLQGKVDLNFVFRTTPTNRLYFFDMSNGDLTVDLVRASGTDRTNDSYYPEVGIFSRCHTHPLEEEQHKGDGRQRFLIDGIWEASDFSGFYGKISDTYALTYISENLQTVAATEADRTFLRESITEKNWQGGGSYGSFYGGLRGRARSRHPLQVESIEYHSPGYIDVVGNKAALNKVIDVINRMLKEHEQISKTYTAIYRALRREGLLRADKTVGFSNPGTEKYVYDQSLLLSSSVGLPNPDAVLIACDSNKAIFAKVVLSYTRRVRDIARFYIEGRVKTGEPLTPASSSG